MKKFTVPYGRGHLEFNLPENHIAGVLRSGLNEYVPECEGTELVKKALENPVGSEHLCKLSEGKKRIVIIASDHTRPVPSRIIMPLMLDEIRRGNPDADITILIATGLHRATTMEELEEKFGSEIIKKEKIVIHDCDDEENLAYIGILPSGGRLIINRLAAEADLLVSEGFIEPHFFAGFSGGRKSVLPGIAGRETVVYNHNYSFIASPCARTGITENNPVHVDMLYAAGRAKLAFIVNVVINSEHKPVYAVAGNYEEAHRAGREFLKERCMVDAVPADIVVSTNGGYPMDQNIYQAVKGMTAAEATVRKNGVIIMVAASADGHGGKGFYKTFRDDKSLEHIMETFAACPPEKTAADQWQSQIFARVLMKATVIFVSECDEAVVRDMHMIPAKNVEEAMTAAIEIVNSRDYSVTVIPDGVSVIVKG